MTTVDWVILCVALAGHFAFWLMANNLIHAQPIAMRRLKFISYALYGATLAIPALFAWSLLVESADWLPLARGWYRLPMVWRGYLMLCWAMALGPLVWWTFLRAFQRAPSELLSKHGRVVDLAETLGHRPIGDRGLRRWFTCLPGNDVFRVEVNEKTFASPRLPAGLDGLSIAHVSDLHFEGAIAREFFEEIITRVNQMKADVIAITGDLFDRRECLAWIPSTLARLEAPLGVYFILGNHDLRLVDLARTRRTLVEAGLIDLGGRLIETDWNGHRVVLAGNELPWIRPAADMSQAPRRTPDGEPWRVLLAHSPDQYGWARRHDVDLMLAGHCHGGQIRFPLIGPLVSPSRRGARYASGTFFERPTLLHVSRGVSSLQTVRFNCPAEISRLVLRSPATLQGTKETIARGEAELIADRA